MILGSSVILTEGEVWYKHRNMLILHLKNVKERQYNAVMKNLENLRVSWYDLYKRNKHEPLVIPFDSFIKR